MVSGEKIDLFELYNFDVHQIYIAWWYYITKFNWKYFPLYFLYIFGVTLTSFSVSDGVVHVELTVPTAKLLSSIRPFIWYTYWGWSRGCFQLYLQDVRWRCYQKTDIRFGPRGPNYSRDDRKKSKIRLWIIKPN